MPRAIPEDIAFLTGDIKEGFGLNRFGQAPDFDIADGFVDVWDGANDGTIAQMSYVFSSSAAIDSISSSNVGDTENIEIMGLDGDWEPVTQTVPLTGQTRAALTTPLLRVFRMKNVGTTDLAGQVYLYENTAIVAGVPTDTTKIRAAIQADNNQTLMAIYSVPAGHTLFMDNYYASLGVLAFPGGNSIDLVLKVRPFGQVFQLKHENSLASTGNSSLVYPFGVPFKVDEKSDIIIQASTSENVMKLNAGFNARVYKT